jgi:hypothetical protein
MEMKVEIGSQYQFTDSGADGWSPHQGDIFRVMEHVPDEQGDWWRLKCLNPNWKGIHENGEWYSSLGSAWQLVPDGVIRNQIKCPNCNCNLNIAPTVVS